MIVIQIELKEVTPGNVTMQARGGHVEDGTTDEEMKAGEKVMLGIDALFRSIGGKYEEVRPLTIIARNAPPEKPDTDRNKPTSG